MRHSRIFLEQLKMLENVVKKSSQQAAYMRLLDKIKEDISDNNIVHNNRNSDIFETVRSNR
jgi:hypothetical protein